MNPHLHPDDYQRLRDAAKRHALQLRQEAIRDAHAWVARGLVRLYRRVLHAMQTQSAPSHPSTLEATTPCPPLS
ncbi:MULTISPECIES: hypothetical protein [unclassified Acidovorax]|uniref:hypothetical protein n=1 Tax=unclassified Acidovorax TaxID=2684926 RepID=UPI000B001AEC|nr:MULTISPECIES: hypothetical protein [unclassified Acidovorax]PUA97758.1 hypothetical protein C8C99_2618 [Acidovorax sp. 107]